MDQKKFVVAYGEIISHCWEDAEFKAAFIADPVSKLVEAGLTVEEGVTYKVVEQPALVQYVVLPADREKAAETMKEAAKLMLQAAEQKLRILPEGGTLAILQNTESLEYLVLPAAPTDLKNRKLSEAALAFAAGGGKTKTYTTQTVHLVSTQTVVAETTLQLVAEVTAVGVAVVVLV